MHVTFVVFKIVIQGWNSREITRIPLHCFNPEDQIWKQQKLRGFAREIYFFPTERPYYKRIMSRVRKGYSSWAGVMPMGVNSIQTPSGEQPEHLENVICADIYEGSGAIVVKQWSKGNVPVLVWPKCFCDGERRENGGVPERQVREGVETPERRSTLAAVV